MPHSITEIIERIEREKEQLGIKLYEKASLNDIIAFEEALNINLSDDFITFYSYCNGFEFEEDMFRIVPLNEIVEDVLQWDSWAKATRDFSFAEYMIYADTWDIILDPADPQYYMVIANIKDEYVELTTSLAEFIERFLNGGVYDIGGLIEWREKHRQ